RNEFCRKRRQALYFALGIADIERDVTSFDITERLHVGTQRLREGSARFVRKDEKDAEYWKRRLLRPRRQRPCCRRAAEQRDEAAAFHHHSIISSARPDRGSGTVMPSALAVLRLRISSTFVACTTGRSAGFSPLRTRPVYTPA